MERNLGFLISAWESLIFDNLHHFWAFQTLKNQNLLQPWWNKAQITILPTLCHHSIMLSNLTNCEKWGQCVCVCVCVCGVTFENASGEIILDTRFTQGVR